jgi:hypothetical protein
MMQEIFTIFYDITHIISLSHAFLRDFFQELSECFIQKKENE